MLVRDSTVSGRGKGIKGRIQEGILKRREEVGVPVGGELPPTDVNKTLAMRLMEARFNLSIAVLLQQGTLEEVAELLGIDQSTVSKWRLRLGLRTQGSG